MSIALPVPRLEAASEAYAPWEEPLCDPAPKLGVVAFQRFVLRELGGGDFGISRACGVGQPSHHHEGRAWDWALDVGKPVDVARADAMIAWLSKPGPDGPDEMARRAGVVSVIWNKQVWHPGQWDGFRPYDGYDAAGVCTKAPCAHPHTDHMHLSFSRAAAAGQTSFMRWLLNGGAGTLPGLDEPTSGVPTWAWLVGGVAIGASLLRFVR